MDFLFFAHPPPLPRTPEVPEETISLSKNISTGGGQESPLHPCPCSPTLCWEGSLSDWDQSRRGLGGEVPVLCREAMRPAIWWAQLGGEAPRGAACQHLKPPNLHRLQSPADTGAPLCLTHVAPNSGGTGRVLFGPCYLDTPKQSGPIVWDGPWKSVSAGDSQV